MTYSNIKCYMGVSMEFMLYLYREGLINNYEISKNVLRKEYEAYSKFFKIKATYQDMVLHLSTCKLIKRPEKIDKLIQIKQDALQELVQNNSFYESDENLDHIDNNVTLLHPKNSTKLAKKKTKKRKKKKNKNNSALQEPAEEENNEIIENNLELANTEIPGKSTEQIYNLKKLCEDINKFFMNGTKNTKSNPNVETVKNNENNLEELCNDLDKLIVNGESSKVKEPKPNIENNLNIMNTSTVSKITEKENKEDNLQKPVKLIVNGENSNANVENNLKVMDKLIVSKKAKKVKNNVKKSKKSNPKKLESNNGCDICFETFRKDLKHIHKQSELHILRELYRTDKNKIAPVSNKYFVHIESDDIREDICSDKQVFVKFLLITNKSPNTCTVYEIHFLYRDMKEIRFNIPRLPIEIKANSSMMIQLNLSLEENCLYLVPFVVKIHNFVDIDNLKYLEHHTLLKELVFSYKTTLMQELKCTSPYKHNNTDSSADWVELDVIAGVRPDKPVVELKLTRRLIPSPIPSCFSRIIENKFRKFDNMTFRDKKYFHLLRQLMHLKNKKDVIKEENYVNLFKTMIYLDEYKETKEVHQFDCFDQTMTRNKEIKNLLTLKIPGLSENRPSLMRGDSVFARMKNDGVRYQGIVHFVHKSSVDLGFDKKFTEQYHKNDLRYDISFEVHRMPFKIEHQALDLVRDHKLEKFFFPKKCMPRNINSDKEYVWKNKVIETNKEQQQAVRHIIECSSYPYPYLVFGPPGTGKTMTLVETIYQIWKTKPKCNILVSTPSNSAANELTERLINCEIPKEDLYRMFARSFENERISDKMKPYVNFINGTYVYPSLETIMTYRILIITLHSSSKLYSAEIPSKHFSYVFIDESGHATEPQTLVAIAGIISSSKDLQNLHAQVILAGDPEQLGPNITSELADKSGYGISMLERLMTTCALYKKNPKTKQYDPKMLTKLLKNYRSHRNILKIPNKLFYDGELQSQDYMKDIKLAENWKHLPTKGFPLIFHNVIGTEEREESSPSYFNLQEVQVVINYLELLLDHKLNGIKINQNHIGIVTPYRKQVQKIQKACKIKHWPHILVDSVEHFQGQERSIIIISTVRSCPEFLNEDFKFKLGFLNNPKRFNVSITRAKSLLIVIGNQRILKTENYWFEFIKYCWDHKAVKGKPFTL